MDEPPRKKFKTSCCVPGCKDYTSQRHRFPKHNPQIFDAWVKAIKPRNFQNMSKEKIYDKFLVCHAHFAAEFYIQSRRGLKLNAIPSINLPDMQDVAVSETYQQPLSLENAGNIDYDTTCVHKENITLPDPLLLDITHQQNVPKTSLTLSVDQSNFVHSKDQFSSPTADMPWGQQIRDLNLVFNIRPDLQDSAVLQTSVNKENVSLTEEIQSMIQLPMAQSESQSLQLLDQNEQANLLKSKRLERSPKLSRAVPMQVVKHTGRRLKYTKETGRKSILGIVNATRISQLTPKEKKIYFKLKEWSQDICKQQQKIESFKKRLETAETLCNSQNFQNLRKSVNDPSYHFIMCQVRNQQLIPKARRYTLDEKVLALSLYKNSGKCYRLLNKIFSLPSGKTLNRLLQKIKLTTGVNDILFDSLKNHVSKMKPQEKTCALVFDEMEIETNLSYDKKSDEIVGFEDTGTKFADHVNVFLLKGVYRLWKQPIAFNFSSGAISAISLKGMINLLIEKCHSINLNVVATVCDQGTNNVKAVKLLREETNAKYLRQNKENHCFGFEVDEKEIIPLFDVPHLFKGLRNNLLNKNLHLKLNGTEKVAKWIHIQQLFALDNAEPFSRLCPKLTDEHIDPLKIKKMKVKICTQVFSFSVGSLLKRIPKWDIQDQNKLPLEAEDTGDLILFLDSLFDSLNCSSYSRKGKGAKPLKYAATKKSDHHNFWVNAIKVVETMKFFSVTENKFVPVPSVKNLLFTLKGFCRLTDKLLNQGFKFLLTGAFNQDALENFFSYIRAHNLRNNNPTASQFMSSYKTLIVNNFMAVHSPGANCKKDIGTVGLDNLKELLTGEVEPGIAPLSEDEEQSEDINMHLPKDVILQKISKIGNCGFTYMSGAIIKILKKDSTVNSCQDCLSNLTMRHFPQSNHNDELIDAKQYERGTLIRPGEYLVFLIKNSFNYLSFLIPRMATSKNISKKLKNILSKHLRFDTINCTNHDLGKNLLSVILRCAIFWWCKSINKVLKGKDNKFQCYLSICKNEELIDPVKLQALKKWQKRRKHSKRSLSH